MGTPKTITTKNKTELPEFVDRAYQDLFERARNAANQGFEKYDPRSRVAGSNYDLDAAKYAIRGLPGVGQQDLAQARTFAGQAGQSIAGQLPGLTTQYMDPYLNEVVGNAQQDFEHSDAVAQNDLLGRAISSGASPFGGDRAGLAAAELARGQSAARNTALGNLRSSGYTSARDTALRALQGDQSAAGTAAGLFTGIGSNAFNQASQAANAQLTAGLQQQGQEQKLADSYWQEFQRKTGFNWDQISKLSGALKGSGDLGNTTIEEKPGPNPLNALIGIIPALLGALPLDAKGASSGLGNGAGWGSGYATGAGSNPWATGPAYNPWASSRAAVMSRGGRTPQHARAGLAVDADTVSQRWADDPVDRIWTLPDLTSPSIVSPQAGLGPPPREPEPAAAAPIIVALPPSGKPHQRAGLDASEASDSGVGLKSGALRGFLGDIASDPVRYALLAGGLATMGSESPFPLTALGQGLTTGLTAAMSRRGDLDRMAQEKEEKAADRALRQAELDAQSMFQMGTNGHGYIIHPATNEVMDLGPMGPPPAKEQPDVQDFFDPATGRQVKGIYDPTAPNGFRPVGGVKAPESTEAGTLAERVALAAGLKPGTPEYEAKVEEFVRAGTPATQESKQAQVLGEGLGKSQLAIRDQEAQARRTLTTLDVMEQAMADPNFRSGTGAGFERTVKRAMVALGAPEDSAASMELFDTQAKQAALDQMGGSLGAGFSNGDRDFVTGQVMSLENTPEGNRAIIEVHRRMAKRALEIAAMAREYAKAHGGLLDMGFDDVVAQFAEAHPVFPKDKPILALGGGTSVTEIADDVGYAKLPSGARYRGPGDKPGTYRVKP